MYIAASLSLPLGASSPGSLAAEAIYRQLRPGAYLAKAPQPAANDLGVDRQLSASALGDEPADLLYAGRASFDSARRAAELWSAALAANPRDFDAAWKLARGDYWLGGHAPDSERRRFHEDGIEAGRKAVAIEPTRPEGHFWIAANMGALAESFGLRAGLRYRKPIKEELELIRRIDPAFEQGSADRALGRWYSKVPRLFGGDRKKAEQHLRASLQYNPNSTASHFFLAELFLDQNRTDEARAELQQVLDAPLDPDWAPEDLEFKEKARDILARASLRRPRRRSDKR